MNTNSTYDESYNDWGNISSTQRPLFHSKLTVAAAARKSLSTSPEPGSNADIAKKMLLKTYKKLGGLREVSVPEALSHLTIIQTQSLSTFTFLFWDICNISVNINRWRKRRWFQFRNYCHQTWIRYHLSMTTLLWLYRPYVESCLSNQIPNPQIR